MKGTPYHTLIELSKDATAIAHCLFLGTVQRDVTCADLERQVRSLLAFQDRRLCEVFFSDVSLTCKVLLRFASAKRC